MRPKASWAIIAIWAPGIIVHSVDPLRSYHLILNLSRSNLYGFGRVFSVSRIWPKYGVGFGKTPNILTKNGIDCFSESRIHQNLVTGCGISPTSSPSLQDPASLIFSLNLCLSAVALRWFTYQMTFHVRQKLCEPFPMTDKLTMNTNLQKASIKQPFGSFTVCQNCGC